MKKNKVMDDSMEEMEQNLPTAFKHQLELEGQCKIQNLTFLYRNIFKGIILTLLAASTLIGILFLAWFKWFRVKIWYSKCSPQQATHVYIEAQGDEGVDDIEAVEMDGQQIYFHFKRLKYTLISGQPCPVGFNYHEKYDVFTSASHLKKGLDELVVNAHRREFGKNEHPVQIPNYFSFLLEVLLKPFFLLQYLVCIAYFVQRLITFGVLNLFFTLLTTSINYLMSYFSFRKIKDMAEKVVQVRVLRDQKMVEIPNYELVPGDLLDPEGEIPCDCLLIKGQIYVNEASLTGENFPIAKFPSANIEEAKEENRWLYEGGKVMEKKGQVLALVVNTGYMTRRGRIIRKILTKVPSRSDLFTKALLFLLEAFVVATIIYFATLSVLMGKEIDKIIVGFRFIDFLGWSFPPTFPIYFNLAYSFALSRLKANDITGTDPDKTVEASDMKIMCFDKTGTLTENLVELNTVMKIKDEDNIIDVTDAKFESEHDLVFKLFATCHTTKKINEQWMGDEIDLRMFLFSDYELSESEKSEVKVIATHEKKGIQLEVLRINQFESKFQSMSVLVRDLSDNGRIYAFIKGAPEKIYRNSVMKVHDYERRVDNFSLGGYRTIACGYRVIEADKVQQYLEGSREIFQEKITPLSLVAFENKLKSDTRETIEKLKEADIEMKIITGDNLFIAVETGVRAGILDAHEPVVLLEGRKQQKFNDGIPRVFKGVILTRHAHETSEQAIELEEDGNYLTENYSMAIDNDFLMLEPQPVLSNKIKIFARISPENKALVVMKFKEGIEKEYQERSFLSRLTGSLKGRVGMCGDGANDLIAIRQSDVGIGINESDASYGASFTITNMIEIDYIIRNSKATVSNIIEMIRYYEFISFLKIPASLLMVTDSTYWNQGQLLYFNFTSTVILPLFMALGRPSAKTTNKIPFGNFMGLINHLRFWGSSIIATAGLVAGFYYITSLDSYVPNANPQVLVTNNPPWNPFTQSASAVFLMVLVPFTMYGIYFYISQPWKEVIYKSKLYSLIVLLNIGATIAQFYITKFEAKVLGMWYFDATTATVLLAISGAAAILGYVYNLVISEVENSE